MQVQIPACKDLAKLIPARFFEKAKKAWI